MGPPHPPFPGRASYINSIFEATMKWIYQMVGLNNLAYWGPCCCEDALTCDKVIYMF